MQTTSQLTAHSLPLTKELSIANHNNKLATDFFIVIEKSPGREKVPSRRDLESRLYSAKTGTGEEIIVKIIDLLFCKFYQLTDHLTLWSNGLNATQFKMEWKEKHPSTTDETEMVVKYFERLKEEAFKINV